MRYGVMLDGGDLGALTRSVRGVADAGAATAWLTQGFAIDAITAIAAIGSQVPGIELGTAVVPTYPRHPLVLAGQALTAQAATGGRLTLGIGLSHRPVVEGVFGYSYDRPVRHLREYLTVLQALLRDGRVAFEGETLRASTFSPVRVADAGAPPAVLVAALGPQMLRLAGELAAGTITWMTGVRTVEAHVVPTIGAGARVVVGLPICVTSDPDAARAAAAEQYGFYGGLPSYRAMLDREGLAGPADLAVIGTEDEVSAHLAAFAGAGATDVMASPFGTEQERARTLALLAALS